MKGKNFMSRLGFALNGLTAAFRSEPSFRAQLVAASGAVLTALWLRPPTIWLALVVVMVALVLAAELVNTALEHALDGLHSEQADFVRIAKDCAAASVLVLSLAAVAVYLLMLFVVYRNQ
jgi:diacylglycerol kinase (ATP)